VTGQGGKTYTHTSPQHTPYLRREEFARTRRYEAGWNVWFKAVKTFKTDSERIGQAAASLRETALDEWARTDTDNIGTWEAYIDWCSSIIKDPATRKANASLRLKKVVQREGQSVRDLLRYIEEIERDLPSLGIEVRRVYVVLDALRDSLRKDVIRELCTMQVGKLWNGSVNERIRQDILFNDGGERTRGNRHTYRNAVQHCQLRSPGYCPSSDIFLLF
jgi:hypothetical protein